MSKTARRIARMHKVIGLVAGVLLLSWTASGLFFSLYPIETIRGDPWRPDIVHGNLAEMTIAVPASAAIIEADAAVEAVTLKPFLGGPVWMLRTEAGQIMVDATTGAREWSERYDQPVTDLFDIQDEITLQIVSSLGSQVRVNCFELDDNGFGRAVYTVYAPERAYSLVAFDKRQRGQVQ